MKAKMMLAAFFVALATMGFDCINSDFLVSVNVKGISATIQVHPGPTTFGADTTFHSSDYLDPDFSDVIKDVRIYDVQVSTIGQFNGQVTVNTVNVNGVPLIRVDTTPWNTFNTPQSLLTPPPVHVLPGGVAALISAIRNRQDIRLLAGGNVSTPVTQNNLFVKIEVFGQFDASVNN